MSDLIQLLKDFAKKNAKVFLAIVIVVIVLLLILFPYIDANFWVFSRISHRVDILEKITKLDYDAMLRDPRLIAEYNAILDEIHFIQDKSFSYVTAQTQSGEDYYTKFISGGLVFWFVGASIFFQKDNDKTTKLSRRLFNRFGGLVTCGLIGWGCALVATRIPTLGNIWVNAVIIPIVILTIVGLLIYGFRKKP